MCRNIKTLFNFEPPATEPGSVVTSAAPRDREIEAAKARERSALRFPAKVQAP
jgi:hypothetical protein